MRHGNVKAPQWLAGALDREDGRELQSRLQLLQGGLSRLVEKLAVGVAEFLEVGLACLRRSKSEPLAGVIVIHPWRFWWVGF